jgi:hypothetical protein
MISPYLFRNAEGNTIFIWVIKRICSKKILPHSPFADSECYTNFDQKSIDSRIIQSPRTYFEMLKEIPREYDFYRGNKEDM